MIKPYRTEKTSDKSQETVVGSPTNGVEHEGVFDPTKPANPKHRPQTWVPWGGLGPWVVVVYALLVFGIASTLAAVLLVLYAHLSGLGGHSADSWLTNSVVAQFWYVLTAEALTFCAIWGFLRLRKTGLRSIGWRGVRFWDPIVALIAYVVYFVAYLVLLAVVTHLIPSININQKQDLGFSNVSGTMNLVLTFLSLVVLPPLVEETVFRGFVFTGLRTRLKWVWAAIITSLLFASAHLLESASGQPLLWVAGIDTFTLSIVLCYLREETDSLWPGVFVHGLKNGIAFLTLFIFHIK